MEADASERVEDLMEREDDEEVEDRMEEDTGAEEMMIEGVDSREDDVDWVVWRMLVMLEEETGMVC